MYHHTCLEQGEEEEMGESDRDDVDGKPAVSPLVVSRDTYFFLAVKCCCLCFAFLLLWPRFVILVARAFS